MENSSHNGNVLLCACGAAAVMLLPNYIINIKNRVRCKITVVLSTAAAKFLPARSVSLLADNVIDSSDPHAGFTANHVRLATEHDLIIVLPATANVLAQAAHGQATTLITTIILASPYPVIFVPTMNHLMWKKPVVQRNLERLRTDGHEIIEPEWKTSYELSSRSIADA